MSGAIAFVVGIPATKFYGLRGTLWSMVISNSSSLNRLGRAGQTKNFGHHWLSKRKHSRLRILVSAYACEPGKGSEPAVGWNWVCQMARFHDVWVLTRRNNRPPIQAELDGRLAPSLHFVYFDLPYWARFWKRSTFGLRLYYCLWQIGVLRVAIRLRSHPQV